jgi:hypothetical protein
MNGRLRIDKGLIGLGEIEGGLSRILLGWLGLAIVFDLRHLGIFLLSTRHLILDRNQELCSGRRS